MFLCLGQRPSCIFKCLACAWPAACHQSNWLSHCQHPPKSNKDTKNNVVNVVVFFNCMSGFKKIPSFWWRNLIVFFPPKTPPASLPTALATDNSPALPNGMPQWWFQHSKAGLGDPSVLILRPRFWGEFSPPRKNMCFFLQSLQGKGTMALPKWKNGSQ